MRIELLIICFLSVLSLSSVYGQNKLNHKFGIIGGTSTEQIDTLSLKTTSGVVPAPVPFVVRLDGPVHPPIKPLVLVDSIEVVDIKQINPDDIKSMTVPRMSQADLIRIYGSKAKDGVILITTSKMKK